MPVEQKVIGKVIIQKSWKNQQRMFVINGVITFTSMCATLVFIVSLIIQNKLYMTVFAILMLLLWFLTFSWSMLTDYYDKQYQLKKSFEVPDDVYLELKYNHRMLRIIAVSLMNNSAELEKEMTIK